DELVDDLATAIEITGVEAGDGSAPTDRPYLVRGLHGARLVGVPRDADVATPLGELDGASAADAGIRCGDDGGGRVEAGLNGCERHRFLLCTSCRPRTHR